MHYLFVASLKIYQHNVITICQTYLFVMVEWYLFPIKVYERNKSENKLHQRFV